MLAVGGVESLNVVLVLELMKKYTRATMIRRPTTEPMMIPTMAPVLRPSSLLLIMKQLVPVHWTPPTEVTCGAVVELAKPS